MNKKIYLPIFLAAAIALMASLAGSTIVSAQSTAALEQIRFPRVVFGKIVNIGINQFVIEKRDGSQLTVNVDERTRYHESDRSMLSFADLKTGRWVAVVGVRQSAEPNLARLVVLFPEGFDPSQFEFFRGRITETLNDSFTINTHAGEQVVNVDPDTIYRGNVADISDLEEGMLAGVVAKEIDGDAVLAKIVRAGFSGKRFVGDVQEVDLSANAFTLQTVRNKKELEFSTNASTRFRSRDGKLSGLADLKAGMTVMVFSNAQATPVSGEPIQALGIAVVDKNALPQIDRRFVGRITSLGNSEFTIESLQGEAIEFLLTGSTIYRSGLRGRAEFDNLKEGMRVLVGVKELSDNTYQAEIVVILHRR